MPNATRTAAAATNAATANVREDYVITNAIVTDVKQERETGRLVVTLNQMFKSIDFRTGEDIESDTFSIDRLALCQQLIPICDELKKTK